MVGPKAGIGGSAGSAEVAKVDRAAVEAKAGVAPKSSGRRRFWQRVGQRQLLRRRHSGEGIGDGDVCCFC